MGCLQARPLPVCSFDTIRCPVLSLGAATRRREFIMLVGSATAWPLAAWTQPDRTYRIGILETIPQASNAANFNALREGASATGIC
jgi:hypothetical protein